MSVWYQFYLSVRKCSACL